ncbi:MAG: DUF4301 family protein [Candidatus Aminicenantes bacterium]|nr:DUF4301 family protein [Candidatus Aminicenantes bacterium]
MKVNLEFLTQEDLRQIKKLGIPGKQIYHQLQAFERGTRFCNLIRPASINDGIKRVSKTERDLFITQYESGHRHIKQVKFIPASGAATRMFEIPLYFLNHPGDTEDWLKTDKLNSPSVELNFMKDFIQGFEKNEFAFCSDLATVMKKGNQHVPKIKDHRDLNTVLNYLLTPKGLNYANLPKALIKFHAYGNHSRTPLEEHLVEASQYIKDGRGLTRLHFTVSAEHRKRVEQYLNSALPGFKSESRGFRISYSTQSPHTNTIAVDEDNQPFRDHQGQLVFRPGGHGALIENLNKLTADLIFITNIDNVVPDHLKDNVILYKKILAGYLSVVQGKTFNYLKQFKSEKCNRRLLDQAIQFCQDHLNIHFPEIFGSWSHEKKITVVFNKLNRPIRICGMVENTGEPGGGPFWTSDHQDQISLQIIEKAQVNPKSKRQQSILSSSTHFNPVDIVCGIKNFKGEKFNLSEFIDPDSYFIAEKTIAGKPLKALELPGLWNGAMANWITLFVEVPITTFNPVKIVNDLLRTPHQGIMRSHNQ